MFRKEWIMAMSLVGAVTVSGEPVAANVLAKPIVQTSFSLYDVSVKHPSYEPFQWAIANGYIKINKNAKVKGKTVTLVYPNATYKEADALMGITKYFWRKEVAQTKPANKKNSASVYYQVAQRKKLPVKSSYKSKSSPTLTKGHLAVLLVSAHYGKPVTLDHAIQRLYQAGITNGNKVGNGYPKTKESFGVNDKVTKSTFVLWMYNYNINKSKLNNVTVKKPPQTDENVPEKYKGRIKVGFGDYAIYTHYGRTYQTRNQQEYDTAFNIIKTRVEQLKKEGWFTRADNTVYKAYVMYYKEGKRAEDFPDDPVMQWALSTVAEDTDFQYLLNKGFTVDELIQLAKMRELAFILEMEAGAKDPLTGEPRSIYDSLVRKQYDCDTTANVYMAIADIMGYDALIIASETHAECYVKAKGEWLLGINVMTDNLFKLLDAKTHFLYTPPRTGLK